MYVHKSNSLSNEVQPYSLLRGSADVNASMKRKIYALSQKSKVVVIKQARRRLFCPLITFDKINLLKRPFRSQLVPVNISPSTNSSILRFCFVYLSIFTLFWLFIFMLIALVRNCGNNGSCNGTVENI
uniref:Uncharacterized protein n=1 Tax=Glossina austeni TaxID=7395 RepID=A0A1A9VQ99_GLOAU